jgi:hypothetical protein
MVAEELDQISQELAALWCYYFLRHCDERNDAIGVDCLGSLLLVASL